LSYCLTYLDRPNLGKKSDSKGPLRQGAALFPAENPL